MRISDWSSDVCSSDLLWRKPASGCCPISERWASSCAGDRARRPAQGDRAVARAICSSAWTQADGHRAANSFPTGDATEAAEPAMLGPKAGSVSNPEPTVCTPGAGDGGDRRMRLFRTWLQGMHAKRRYASYDEYISHQT